MPELPIGSIIAFGGSRITRAWETKTGWLHCDGRLLDRTELDPNRSQLYRDLHLAIGFAWGGDSDTKFNLPDLQGFFLRGVDASRPIPDLRNMPFPVDPDRDKRIQSRPGGNTGQSVGSVQMSATALAWEKPFRTAVAGDHHHYMNFQTNAARDVNGQNNTVAEPNIGGSRPVTDIAGFHEHEIVGGDKETRPVNAYVYWIIRYK